MISCKKLVDELDRFLAQALEDIHTEIVVNREKSWAIPLHAVCCSIKEFKALKQKVFELMPGFYDQVKEQHTFYYEVCLCDDIAVLSIKGSRLIGEKEAEEIVYETCLEASESIDPEWTFSRGTYDRSECAYDLLSAAVDKFQEQHPAYADKIRTYLEITEDWEHGARQLVFSAQYRK